jgi:SAM-dependent methyltransferase
MKEEHTKANRDLWNCFAKINVNSSFYDVETFVKGRSSLSTIESDLLGDVAGRSILHLQCHFGMDTLSLARMGAEVTGVDFSEVAIEKARDLNQFMELRAKFLTCDVNVLDQHLEGKFDIVFASFGVIGWHSDLERWALIASHFMKESGRFCLAEFHPVLWMLDDNQTKIEHSYFKKGPIVGVDEKSYADRQAGGQGTSYCWNHSLGELFGALESAGLNIFGFKEYDYSPYDCFSNGVGTAGKHYIQGFEGIVPLAYSLSAKKQTK